MYRVIFRLKPNAVRVSNSRIVESIDLRVVRIFNAWSIAKTRTFYEIRHDVRNVNNWNGQASGRNKCLCYCKRVIVFLRLSERRLRLYNKPQPKPNNCSTSDSENSFFVRARFSTSPLSRRRFSRLAPSTRFVGRLFG